MGVTISHFDEIQQRVGSLYKGLTLESVVQGWVYLEDYEQGIWAHTALTDPSPQDDRWLGVCYSMTGDRLMALEALYRAVRRGEAGARVELARVLSFLERDAEAIDELKQVNVDSLNPADQVLWFRAFSIQQEYEGNLMYATELAEEAWRRVQGIPEFPHLAPWVLMRLASLHFETGRAQRGLWYLNRAQELTSGPSQWSLRLLRTEILISLGRYEEVLQELEVLNSPDAPTPLRPVSLFFQAEAALAVADVRGALDWYSKAVAQALEDQDSNTELLSRLALATLLSFRGVLETASEHLARARILISSRRDQLNYHFREVLHRFQQEALGAEDAARELEGLVTSFGEMGLLQEQGWVRLHLAELYRQMGDARYLKEFDRLQVLCATLQNRAFLAREWVLLPQLREAALLSHPKLAGERPVVLEVYTLGQEKVTLAGQVINIRLRRGVELLAYFLLHKEVSLKRLLIDVFADEDPKTARIYFHQFRNELHERLPELSVVYDAKNRLYRLESKLDILWDVAELRAGRRMGDLGIFLPGSGSDWVSELDETLESLKQGDVAQQIKTEKR